MWNDALDCIYEVGTSGSEETAVSFGFHIRYIEE